MAEEVKVLPKKYLVFRLNDSQYGVSLAQVKEVIALPTMVPIPQAPSYLMGMINLRGRVISAVDLKTKMGFAKTKYDPKKTTVILIEHESTIVGFIVDSIQEVIAVLPTDIEGAADATTSAGLKDYMLGVARFEKRPMVLLVDLAKIIQVSEMSLKAPAA